MHDEVRLSHVHLTQGEMTVKEVRATVGEFVVEWLDIVVTVNNMLIPATATASSFQ